jgi:hypothetical protein
VRTVARLTLSALGFWKAEAGVGEGARSHVPHRTCYHAKVLMKRNYSTSSRLVTSFLLVGLMFSATAAVGARNSPEKNPEQSGPNLVRSAAALSRLHLLTAVSSQRIASDISKQNSIKRAFAHGGLTQPEFLLSANTLLLLVATERSLSYLSFRLSRPGGRAPPASV